MNDKIFYGDGTQPKRNTRILDLIDQETKDRWKAEEEERRKPKTTPDITNAEDFAKKPLKDFITITSPEDSGNIYLQQQQECYNRIVERLKNGEVIHSGDDDLFCTMPELQQMLKADNIATMLTLPTRTQGYRLKKM